MKRPADILPFFTAASYCPRPFGARAAFVVAVLLITSALRWVLNPYLGEEIPFLLYLPGILIVGAYCGFATGFAALVGSLILSVVLWVHPAMDGWRIDLASALGLGFRFVISTLLLLAMALLQKSAAAQKDLLAELKRKSRQLEEKSARLELSERKLAAHAENLERLVAVRTAKLEETIGELEEFSYTVSHDLRSPLRAMQGFAHLLLEEYSEKLDAEGRHYVRQIDRAAQRLDALIHDVLSYSKLGRAKIELHPVDLEAAVDQVVNEYAAGSERPEIEIVRPLLPVIASESCLVQALSNLIQNAVKFVAPAATAQVRIWTEPRGSHVRLHVTDRGIGIPAATFPHLFKPFHRAHQAAGYEGTGIGLAIVKRAVERQGGTVGVTSEPGKGSDFWFELAHAMHPTPPPP